jgi:uncharacterized membrane protein
MTDTWQPVPAIVKRTRMAAMASYFGLIGLFTGDALVSLFQGAPWYVALILWLVRVAPLFIFLPGLRRNHLRTYAWLSFAIMLYFMHAVNVAFIPADRLYGLLYCLLCVSVFCTLVLYIRAARKHLGMTLQ